GAVLEGDVDRGRARYDVLVGDDVAVAVVHPTGAERLRLAAALAIGETAGRRALVNGDLDDPGADGLVDRVDRLARAGRARGIAGAGDHLLDDGGGGSRLRLGVDGDACAGAA